MATRRVPGDIVSHGPRGTDDDAPPHGRRHLDVCRAASHPTAREGQKMTTPSARAIPAGPVPRAALHFAKREMGPGWQSPARKTG